MLPALVLNFLSILTLCGNVLAANVDDGTFTLIERAKLKRAEQKCSTKDFSPRFAPIRNQGQWGSCFAFAAADLISYRMNLPPNKEVSALDVAIRSYFEKPGDIPPIELSQGGQLKNTTEAYLKSGGACYEDKLRSEDPKSPYYMVLQQLNWGMKYGLLGGYEGFLDPKAPAKNPCDGSPTSPEEARKISSHLNRFAIKKTIQDIDRRCGPRIPLPKYEVKNIYGDLGYDETLDAINKQLNSSNVVGIGYNACFIGPKYVETREGIIDEDKHGCSPHAGVIVGRQWNKQKQSCDYMIRNSWGKDCSIYRADIQKQCKKGVFFLNENELMSHFISATWLQ